MAIGDPNIDPLAEEQLYGLPPMDLSDMAPAAQSNPWDLVPAEQDASDDDNLRQRIAGLPPLQAPPGHVPGVDPFLDAMYGVAAPASPVPAPMPAPGPQVGAPPPIAGNPWTSPLAEALPASPFDTAAPDALTGAAGQDVAKPFAGQAPAPFLTPEQAYRQSAKRLTESPFDPNTGDIRADVSDADARRYFDELYQRDPLKAIDFNNQFADAKTARALAERQRIENENWDRAKQIDADRRAAAADAQRKSDEIAADAERILSTPIDASGGVSGGRAVAGILAAFMGGLVQGKTGSPVNAGLQALNTAIDRGIDAQKADMMNARARLDLRRNTLADEIARHGDEFRAQEAMRLAALQHASNQLDIEMQNYSPRGTAFAKAAAMKAGVVAQMAKSAQERGDKLFEAGLKQREQDRKDAETQSVIAKNKAEASKLYRDAKADKQVWTPDQLGILHPGLPVPPISMSQKDYGQWLESGKTGEELIGKRRANSPNERARELAVAGVVDNKGDPVLFRNDTVAAQVSQAKEDADELVRLTDEMVAMIKKNGWSSDLAKSDAWRKARSNYGSIIIRKKEQDKLGVLTGPDVDLVTKEIGTEDPTEARSPLAGLEQFRHNIVEGINAKMRNGAFLPEGRSVQRWEPKAPPTETAAADQITGRTALEQRADAKPGPLARALFTPFGVEHGGILDPETRAEEGARVGPTGLALEDNDKVLATIRGASKSAPDARAALVDKLAAWAQSPRPSVASGVLGLIRGESPALYNEIIAKLPAEQREALPDFSGLPGANLPRGAK